jgi:hypothetical protein
MVNNIRLGTACLSAALVLGLAPVPSAGRAVPTVGALRGEMVVLAEDGTKVGRLEATATYLVSAQGGDTSIRFTPVDTSTTVTAKATYTAGRYEEAFGAVTALVLAIADRSTSGRSTIRLSNVKIEGDPAPMRAHVDAIVAWWDAQAEMSVAGYGSPLPGVAHIGKLQFNVWGTEVSPSETDMHGYGIVVFDPANPGVVSGGRIVRREQNGGFTVVDLPEPNGGQLTPMLNTPTPNDYLLTIGGIDGGLVRAELLIDVLPDGTFDVRGAATRWVIHLGAFSVEGRGNTTFVPAGS